MRDRISFYKRDRQFLPPESRLLKYGTAMNLVFSMVMFFLFSAFYQDVVWAELFNIGPGHKHENLRDFDWNGLGPGDIVQIHYRAVPYREKLVIRKSGTRKRPIIIRGVPDAQGALPVLDGENALHFQKMCEGKHYARGMIVLGDCNPSDYIVIQGLEIRNANNINQFKRKGLLEKYTTNAAGIFLNKGQHVQIKGCEIHSCGMGILTAYYPNTDQFYLGHSKIYNNGDFTRTRWGHNVYLGARTSLIEFNWFGELFSDGNNIKDRSHKTIIRYNWIEGGMSRQIDLVESRKYRHANAFVYGNVIIHGRRVKNPKMILFGGDLTDAEGKGRVFSRSGTLYFFNNTVVSRIDTKEAFLYLNRFDCRALIQNNVMIGRKKISAGKGKVSGVNNFFSFGAEATDFLFNSYGGYEQFRGGNRVPFVPHKKSLLVNRGTHRLPAKVKYMPSPDMKIAKRPVHGAIDIGAFER